MICVFGEICRLDNTNNIFTFAAHIVFLVIVYVSEHCY